jgi:hypothetical protein
VARAHQHAAGARRRGDLQAEPPGGVADEPAVQGLGRSRDGLTTKVHLACEQGHKPLSVVITAGQRGDSPQFQVVLGAYPGPPGRPGAAAHPAGPAAGRQGLRLSRQPRLPAATRDPVHDPGEGRPGPPPQGQGPPRWPSARLRPRRLQGPPRRGMRHQPAQAQPRRGHPLRQAGRPLRSHRLHRRDRRMALTPTFETRDCLTGCLEPSCEGLECILFRVWRTPCVICRDDVRIRSIHILARRAAGQRSCAVRGGRYTLHPLLCASLIVMRPHYSRPHQALELSGVFRTRNLQLIHHVRREVPAQPAEANPSDLAAA